MDILFFVIAVVLVGLVVYIVYFKQRRDERRFDQLYNPADGGWDIDEDDLEAEGSIAFAGDTDFVSQKFIINAGKYKLVYTFPDDVLIQVEFSSVDGTDHEILATKSGSGEVGFSVVQSGRYFCKIAPAKDSDWEIEIRRVGQAALSG